MIQTWPEGAPAVIEEARAIPQVHSADHVEGAFDVIVRVPAEDEKDVLIKLLRVDQTMRALVCRPTGASADGLAKLTSTAASRF